MGQVLQCAAKFDLKRERVVERRKEQRNAVMGAERDVYEHIKIFVLASTQEYPLEVRHELLKTFAQIVHDNYVPKYRDVG